MKDWSAIPEIDYNRIWDKFDLDFSFTPSVDSKDWPSIKTEKPFLKFTISDLGNENLLSDFIKKAIDAFIGITNEDEQIIALDWQHECFYINPGKIKVPDMLDFSTISFIPNGDYYIFLTNDFENVWFGHPWEKSITVIGDRLINAFNRDKLLL